MKDTIFIIFNKNGIKSLFKKTSKMKSLPTGSFIAKLNLEVPDGFFKNHIPEINATLKKEDIFEIKNIEAEVKQEEKPPIVLFFERMDKR